MAADLPFWKTKTLGQMTDAEWESLCDGCGRCCLHKLRDEDTDRIIHTEVSCRLLDTDSCLCSDYPRRRRKVPDCVRLTPAALAGIDWLPPTCGYRRIDEGLDLEWWHPLVSGSPDSVHQAGVSVRGRAISERIAGPLEDHVADWPGELPAPLRTEPPQASSPGSKLPRPVPPGSEPPEPASLLSGRPQSPPSWSGLPRIEPAPSGPGNIAPDGSGPVRSASDPSVPDGPAPAESGFRSGPSLGGQPGSALDGLGSPRSGPSRVSAPPGPGPVAPARADPARPTIRLMPAVGRTIPR